VDLARYLAARARLVERALAARLPASRGKLRQAVRYSLLAGGTRIRPILTLAAAEVAGGSVAAALPFACASR
jgi:geranylgeranyl diphosphate synthase type II